MDDIAATLQAYATLSADPMQLLDRYDPKVQLEAREVFEAVRAVLILHKPTRDAPELTDYCAGCARLHRRPLMKWPCKTVRTIIGELEQAGTA